MFQCLKYIASQPVSSFLLSTLPLHIPNANNKILSINNFWLHGENGSMIIQCVSNYSRTYGQWLSSMAENCLLQDHRT